MSATLTPERSPAPRAHCAPVSGSTVESRARRDALAIIEREDLVVPAVCYRIVPVLQVRGDCIDVGETMLCAPGIAAGTGELRAVAAAACSLGSAIQERISSLFATRRRSLALALDAAGNEILFRLADRTLAEIKTQAQRKDLMPGIEASPGDPGVPLHQQAAVLALSDAASSGIAATESGMLSPLKSLSFLLALGTNLHRGTAPTRCACCPSRDRCRAK